jgi:hypothetical protein
VSAGTIVWLIVIWVSAWAVAAFCRAFIIGLHKNILTIPYLELIVTEKHPEGLTDLEIMDRGRWRAALMRNVERGYLEIVGHDEAGEPQFRLTEAGRARVESILGEVRK